MDGFAYCSIKRGDIMLVEETLPNWLLKRAYLTPDRIALIFNNKKWTFKQLKEDVISTAKKLHFAGVQKGDRVAVLLKNHPNTVMIIHALQLLGCEAVLLNIRLQEKELLFQITDSEVKFLITEEELLPNKINFHSHLPNAILINEQIQDLKEKEFEYVTEFRKKAVCTIMYTSGTTGFPKGVLQTYGNHWSSAIGNILNLGLQENDAWLTAVPLFHISGYSILIRSVLYGIPVILYDKFDEKRINQDLIAGKATIVSVVTAMLQRLIDNLGEREYHPALRCFLLGGGPAPVTLLKACKSKGIPVFQSYGMTETSSQIVTLSPEDSLEKIGSAGKPLFLSEVKIITDNKIAKPMEIGEIVVKGPNVTIGYYKREETNEKSFTRDGWFYTGDVGYMDEEGFLFVIDRRSDLIISGGENIYPAEVENVIQTHPGILEAAVVGITDEKWGQIPYGIFVEKDGWHVEEQELQKLCEEQLAKFKVPKKWLKTTHLPKTASNKIMRRRLREMIENNEWG